VKRTFPFPLPNGWYQIAWSDELAPGQVVPLRYFDRDLVVFRTESGRPHVLDAFCPHLGAHLGHGSQVVGDALQCPFHAWRYDGSGACVHIPYARKIPARAQVRAWPVCEKNGMVLTWFHAAGDEPQWEIPEVPEYGSDEWTPWERREWTIRTRNQEMAENTVDPAHFRYVHGTQTIAETEIRPEGPVLHVVAKTTTTTAQGPAEGRIETQSYGLGWGITRFKGIVETLLITSGTPIDEERVHMRLSSASAAPSSPKSSANSARTSPSGKTKPTGPSPSSATATARSARSGAGASSSTRRMGERGGLAGSTANRACLTRPV
jgi:phenylpropionate dioxygenase-like ring-hydroxylating dioxygenase large terminal subunit